ncbi:MAG: pyridoxamine 5'-phosphate oxidase family protein [Amphritea sp.]|nr:pyridoxamine 5'-phosphate oxidase family protein [Amphritea sp.]
MSDTPQVDDEALTLLDCLLESSQTLQLATSGEAGPEASYAPFIFSQGALYIYISQLAGHTANVIRSSAVGVMLIEDEATSRNQFARNRITLQCTAEVVDSDSSEYEARMTLYRQKHGATVDLLRSLPDFMLFRLTPLQGRLVIGFGRAFTLQMPGFHLQPITAK